MNKKIGAIGLLFISNSQMPHTINTSLVPGYKT